MSTTAPSTPPHSHTPALLPVPPPLDLAYLHRRWLANRSPSSSDCYQSPSATSVRAPTPRRIYCTPCPSPHHLPARSSAHPSPLHTPAPVPARPPGTSPSSRRVHPDGPARYNHPLNLALLALPSHRTSSPPPVQSLLTPSHNLPPTAVPRPAAQTPTPTTLPQGPPSRPVPLPPGPPLQRTPSLSPLLPPAHHTPYLSPRPHAPPPPPPALLPPPRV